MFNGKLRFAQPEICLPPDAELVLARVESGEGMREVAERVEWSNAARLSTDTTVACACDDGRCAVEQAASLLADVGSIGRANLPDSRPI
jgi:hypothetical protein